MDLALWAMVVKTVHIASATFFFGGGMLIAYFKLRADRCGNLEVLTWYQEEIVFADKLFTVPSAVLLPMTGFLLVWLYGMSFMVPWVRTGIVLYGLTGLLWLPAFQLQREMRAIAQEALRNGTVLPPRFHRANRIWFGLGIPAFLAALYTVWIMVSKRGF